MDSLKLRLTLLLASLIFLTSCQLGYVMKSGVGQLKLLNNRVAIEKVLERTDVSAETKQKLRLALEARKFAEEVLHLKRTKNYTSYVELDRPYVTYVVSAAERWQLKGYQWSYPLMGKMPYKGFFNELDAQDLSDQMQSQGYDAYMRGVTAYSTLGWFNDPILSSMLRYDDYDLVNTIIHETVHATLFIKNAADFNERFASFLGQKGAELFYLQKEGPESKTLLEVRQKNHDQELFSKFISAELKELEHWYKQLPDSERTDAIREKRIQDIQNRFSEKVLPQLQSNNFSHFPKLKLNNARLMVYKTYLKDLSDFEKLYKKVGNNYQAFIEKCKSLQNAKDPEATLKSWVE